MDSMCLDITTETESLKKKKKKPEETIPHQNNCRHPQLISEHSVIH